MGAEQSSSLLNSNHDGLGTSFGNSISLDGDGPASLPPSPQRSSLTSSRGLSREGSQSMTVSNFNSSRSLSTLPTNLDAELPSVSRLSKLDSDSKAASVSRSHQKSPSMSRLNRSSGIVVVCPGPMRRMRSTGSLDSPGYLSGRMEAASIELKKLRKIPVFEPLIGQSANNLSDTPIDQSFGRRLEVSLPRVTPEQLVSLVKVYGDHVRHRANVAHQRQIQVIGLQNKVDYETRRVWTDLQARENGSTIPSPKMTSNQSSFEVGSPPVDQSKAFTYAGRLQVDAVVLQTSQIFGLIDQCSNMVERLRETVAQLKKTLPKSDGIGLESTP